MAGRLTQSGSLRVAVLVFVTAGLVGCAAGARGPRGPMREPGLKHGRDESDIPPASFLLVRATIVDLNPAGGTMTVKDDQSHGTWTVAVTKETLILGANGRVLTLNDFQVGQKVRVRGYSRIEEILTAIEVERETESR